MRPLTDALAVAIRPAGSLDGEVNAVDVRCVVTDVVDPTPVHPYRRGLNGSSGRVSVT